MADYATPTQVKAHLVPTSYDSSTDTVLGELITSASRLIDSYLTVENDFFAVAGASKTAKVVYGRGGDRLRLPPFTETITAADMTVPSGYVKPVFAVVDGWLTIPPQLGLGLIVGNAPEYNPYLYSFISYVSYTISAKWGWAAIPEDIREACVQIVVRWFRGRDDAYAGIVTAQSGQAFERAIPAGAKMILDEWKGKLIQLGHVSM